MKCKPGCTCGKHSRPDMIGNQHAAYPKPRQPGPHNPGWLGDAARPESIKARGRRVARKRYSIKNVRCQKCRKSPAEHRHHIDGDVHNNESDNIMLVCEPCHWAEHEVYDGR